MVKYYKYYPAMINKRNYKEEGVIPQKLKFKTKYSYLVGTDYGILRANKKRKGENEYFDYINFIAYQENGKMYDVITKQELTLLPLHDEMIEVGKIYCYFSDSKLDMTEVVSELTKISKLPRRVLTDYNNFIVDELKTTSKEEYLKKVEEQKKWEEVAEQMKEYHNFVKKKQF